MDLLSLEINAVDYVEDYRKEELERALIKITGRSDIPKWVRKGSIIGPFFNTQDWGDVRVENLDNFEEVKIHVLLCQTLPIAYIVVVSGRVNRNFLEGSKKKNLIEDIRKKFETQTRDIFDKISGIVSTNKLAVFGQINLIIASFRCDENEIGISNELGRKMIESRIEDAEIKHLNIIIRDRDIFRDLGINAGGLVSVTNLANNYVSFINQPNTVNFYISYDEYLIVEFGNNIQFNDFTTGFPTHSGGISQQLGRLAILQMLVFWLRSKLMLFDNLKEKMKELKTKAFESEAKEVSKIHQELWQGENEFLKKYSDFSDAMNSVQDYLKFERMMQKDQFRKEIALPMEGLVSSETGKPAAWGVFDIITEDIEGGSSRVMNFYTLLKEQYSIVSGNLRDRINISLATSNVKLQKQLRIYTFILVILTVVLLLQGFGWFK